ncbi:MAG: DUF1569 domain-containing protein [Bacteroidota bacterium]
MKRRNFLKIAAPVVALPVVGTWAFDHHFSSHNGAKRSLAFTSLDGAIQELNKIKSSADFTLESGWSLYQNLIHCAQSIEFSMDGFPEMKSELFQNTIGSLVFNHFEKQGYMRHNRAEAIPGAPDITKEGNLDKAFDRVEQAVIKFDQFSGALKPHFAYGQLSKSEYEEAHCMHLADHFAMITFGTSS